MGLPSTSEELAIYRMSDASRYQAGGSFAVDGGRSIFRPYCGKSIKPSEQARISACARVVAPIFDRTLLR